MPIALLLLLAPIIKAVARLITGAVTASIVYYFLMSVVAPITSQIEAKILDTVNQLSTVGGTAFSVISYLDLGHCVAILLAASSACFSIKIMSVAIRAFGINTG